jgi:catechol 2,3-dioxygenase-like lactoylglutathione lyase family enzyme
MKWVRIMPRLDHLSLPVHDWQRSRDWYKNYLGFEIEFEVPDRKTAAMRDDADLTIFLYEAQVADCPGISFTIQVDDVAARHDALSAAGISFVHPPMKVFWGYGAELRDPDGYILRLWDPKSMEEK